jgi:DNA invertase Pin-like site-specific DNA recombinase
MGIFLPILRGEQSKTSKLSEAEVLEIRRAADGGKPTGEIAIEYRISRTHVRRLARREQWGHLDEQAS